MLGLAATCVSTFEFIIDASSWHQTHVDGAVEKGYLCLITYDVLSVSVLTFTMNHHFKLKLYIVVLITALHVLYTNANSLNSNDFTAPILNPLAYRTCSLNDKQWIMLRMYFSRVTLIEVTDLLNEQGLITRFSSHLVHQLSTSNVSLLAYKIH